MEITSFYKKSRENRSRSSDNFYKMFMVVGIPLIIQQLLTSSLNFIDNIMLGKLGAQYIAGVGFANNIYRIQDIMIFGICSGVGVFIAQYNGKKDYKTIKKLIGGMFFMAMVVSIIIVIISQVFTSEIIGLFSKEEEPVRIGISYLRISSYSYLVASAGFALAFSLRCLGKTKVPMVSAGISVLVNCVLNYILINGKLGFPPMYERGAAIATIISRFIQGLVVLYCIYKWDYKIKGKFHEYLGLSREFIKKIRKVGTPIFLTEIFWVLGTVALSIAFSRLGTGEAAAVQIADIVFSIAAIIFMGVSNATSVIIGKSIGEGKKILSKHYAGKSLKLAVIFSFFSIIVLQILVKPILSFYTLTPEYYKMALYTLRVYNFIIFFKLLNWTLLIGILRAGGDTKVAFYLDILPLYLYAIPLAYICLYFKVPIYVAVAIVNFEEVIKFSFSIRRYFSMKWLKDLTRDAHTEVLE